MSSIIQSVVSNQRSPITAPQQNIARRAQGPGQLVSFGMELVDEAAENSFTGAPVADLEQLPTLKPGLRYSLLVSITTDELPGQRPVRVNSDLELYLQSGEGVVIANPNCVVSRDLLAAFEHEFELTVASECPAGNFSLILSFREAGNPQRPRLAASLSYHLQGTYYPASEKFKDNVKVELDASPPEHLAILHVVAPRPGKFCLAGWSHREPPLFTDQMDQPPIKLSAFVEEGIEPEYIRNEVRSFSRRSSIALHSWLDKLRRRHGEHLCLIIADHTDSDFPWEMFELRDGIYLGAQGLVVRWVPIQFYDIWRMLNVSACQLSGSLIAYLDQVELSQAHVDEEREALNALMTSYCDTVAKLKQQLSAPLNNIALVYLGCHGIFTYSDKHKTAVGSLKNPFERLVSIDLEDIGDHEQARPVLFVNACHSGRLMRDSSGLYGLPEVFLARVASGYIGTLGPVGSAVAAKIARRVLNLAAARSIQPAEILRQLRAEVAQRVAADGSRENWLEFIYTFMYIYYGNPLATLQLKAVEKAGEKN